MKKTVQVVQQLVEPYRGSFQTVYVDRFYTSVDLIKELHEMKLFVTGTILSNRIPKTLTIAKSSREFKQMERGDMKAHVLHYKDKEGKVQKAGLVLWKDRTTLCIALQMTQLHLQWMFAQDEDKGDWLR